MGERTILICVFPGGGCRLTASADPRALMRQWTRRYGDFIPVAAFQMDPDAFAEAFHIPRLPKTTSTEWAAVNFHRAPVQLPAQADVFRHIKKVGPAVAGLLLAEWRDAVKAVTSE